MFFYQMAAWIWRWLWSTRMLRRCCCHDGQHRHQQVSQTGDIINTPINYVSTEPIGSAQICSSTVPGKKSLRRRTHIFPQAMNHQPTSRNRTWVGSILSPIYHWFLMFRTNDVGKNKSFWNEWNITWRETHACHFLVISETCYWETT